MKSITTLLTMLLIATMSLPAAAEVEEVAIGESIWMTTNVLTPGFFYQEGRKELLVAVDEADNDEYWVFETGRVTVNARSSGGARASGELQSYDFRGIDEHSRDGGPESSLSGFGHYAGRCADPMKPYNGFSEMKNVSVLEDGTSVCEDSVGLELVRAAHYQYTEDLTLTAGHVHVFFPGTPVEETFSPDGISNHLYVRALLAF